MNMRGPPRVGVVAPGIGTRLDRNETIIAVLVGQRTPAASEVCIQRRTMLIALMSVAPGCIRLPNFDQGIGDRFAVFIL